MTDIKDILRSRFPKTEERIEGQLVFLEQYEIVKLGFLKIQEITKLDFYKIKFFTGYRKFTITDIVVGLSGNQEIFLLANPIFSSKYSNLIKIIEQVEPKEVGEAFISDVVSMYRETGVTITDIDAHNFQVWFGDDRWRILSFEINGGLTIKTIPNSDWRKARRSWWRKLFGSR